MSTVLGRTNQAFPPVWLKLCVPDSSADLAPMLAAAQAAETVLDFSVQPALFGGHMRGTNSLLMATGGSEIENAADEKNASDLIDALLIQLLSSVGREHLDFFFLNVRQNLEEFQISGALQALEAARQEGHIRFLGLACNGQPLAVLGTWQFHDAFEVLLLRSRSEFDDDFRTLEPMAKERRVGIVMNQNLNPGEIDAGHPLPQAAATQLQRDSLGHTTLIKVFTPHDVAQACKLGGNIRHLNGENS